MNWLIGVFLILIFVELLVVISFLSEIHDSMNPDEAKEKIVILCEPKAGTVFKHFKGGTYMLDGSATHTESGDRLVIYHNIDNPDVWYARPAEMFYGTTPDGERRFTMVQEEINGKL